MSQATYHLKFATESDRTGWDAYVRRHSDGSLFHLFGWADVMRGAYDHATYSLMLLDDSSRIVGLLQVVHLRHAIFGNGLVSLPFVDGGGILADDRQAQESLLAEVLRLGEQVGAKYVELRHERPLEQSSRPLQVATRSHKVRMLLGLPQSSDMLVKSFKSKLRSQINRALKEGFSTRIGGLELLEDFYKVFLVNMRDLGSPVHSVKLMRHCLIAFPQQARIIVVYHSTEPVAAALVIGFGNVLRNPWASSLRKYASRGPNMLLYLRMLQHACDHGYELFDFGRSSPGEGTYRFKEQWGAVPKPLYWHYVSLDGRLPDAADASKARFDTATRCWQRLPLIVTRIIGPRIRKHISL